MTSVRVRVPATSANLGPGFDALGLALDIHNEVELAESAQDDQILVEGEEAAQVPRDASNIALQAARALLQQLGAPPIALHMRLKNAIPLARGLGSSAAARAGALVAANELARVRGWGKATPEELVSLAARLEGHPDNTSAALLGGLGASISTQDGAVAERVPCCRYPRFAAFVPDQPVETARARAVLPDMVSRADAVYNVGRTALLMAAMMTGDFELLPHALDDRLHQSQRASLMPGYSAAREAALELGAYGVTLSGAGPTILAWLPPDADARRFSLAMHEATARAGVEGRAHIVRVDWRGCVPIEE